MLNRVALLARRSSRRLSAPWISFPFAILFILCSLLHLCCVLLVVRLAGCLAPWFALSLGCSLWLVVLCFPWPWMLAPLSSGSLLGTGRVDDIGRTPYILDSPSLCVVRRL